MSFGCTADRINTVGELSSKENDGKDSRLTPFRKNHARCSLYKTLHVAGYVVIGCSACLLLILLVIDLNRCGHLKSLHSGFIYPIHRLRLSNL